MEIERNPASTNSSGFQFFSRIRQFFSGVLEFVSRIPLLLKWAVIGVVALLFVFSGLPRIGGWATLVTFTIALIFAATALERIQIPRMHFVLTVTLFVSAIVYITWRITVIDIISVWISVPLFFAELLGTLHLFGFYYTTWPREEPAFNDDIDPGALRVFAMVPTVNEGREVLEPTLKGLRKAREAYLKQYPHGQLEVVICNDGYVAGYDRWQDAEDLAEKYGFTCITREVGGGAKAGNIENARHTVGAVGDDALMAIFDTDMIPEPNFFTRIVPYFRDTQVGWVQTGQYYRNTESPIAMWANDQHAMFYNVLCPGKSTLNSMSIGGTNFVIRCAAMDEIDGLPQDSITEDLAAAITLQPNWRSVYLSDRLTSGLGPMDFKSYFKQQRRWATGNMQIGLANWKELLIPGYGNLNFAQRIQYLLVTTHYICGLRDMIYLLTPLMFLLFSASAIDYTNMPTFLWYAVPYWIMSQVALWYVVRGRAGMRGIMLNFTTFPIYLQALMTVVTGKQIGFQVTSKQRLQQNSFMQIRMHLFFILVCILCIFIGVYRLRSNIAPVVVSMIWTLYQITYLSSIVWLAASDWIADNPERRHIFSRQRARLQPVYRSLSYVFVVGAFSVGVTQIATGDLGVSEVTAGEIMTDKIIGISVPHTRLTSEQPVSHELTNIDFELVGRTQHIDEDFDVVWATNVDEMGATPWVTVVFDNVMQTNNLDDGLLAIANGNRDEEIRTWANQIKDYGDPLYITWLPHVDMHWGLPSAVVPGARPGDARRAWTHIQSIFEEEGARNVLWVWAPFDLLNDEPFAPDASTIDAVLYQIDWASGSQWDGLKEALPAITDDVLQRYPEKPVFMEFHVGGEVAEKESYLRRLRSVVASRQQIQALIYHEGSRQEGANQSDHEYWSMLADPTTFSTVENLLTDFDENTLGTQSASAK